MCISESNSDFRMLLSFRSVSSPHSEAVFKATHWKKVFLCCFHPTLCVRLVVLSAALFIHDDFEANVNELIWTHRPKVTDSIYCVVFSLSHVLCVAVAAFNLIRLLFSFLLLLISTIRRCVCLCGKTTACCHIFPVIWQSHLFIWTALIKYCVTETVSHRFR